MLIHRTSLFGLVASLLMVALSACTMDSPPVKGFVLPQGDVALGETVFVKYGCHGCHSIPGVDLPGMDAESVVLLEIGGEVYRVKNTGELLTSVISPDHVISPEYLAKIEAADQQTASTPMPFYGDTMTITEMINLVAFLQVQYSKLMPDFFESYLPEDMKESG